MAETEDTSATEESDTLSVGEEALIRLILPTVALVLAILYVDSVHGRIALPNLRYPYFVITVLVVLILSIYAEEFLTLRRIRKEEEEEEGRPAFTDGVTARIKKWWRSIALAVLGFVYLWVIEILGFFVSSALLMIAVMVIAGVRDYRKLILVTAAVLIGIRLFLNFMNMSVPEGMFI